MRKKAVIVGDLKQLPNVVDSRIERKTDVVFADFDFFIFEKIGKTPRLIIEVGGIAFHKKGTRQAWREEMKMRF